MSEHDSSSPPAQGSAAGAASPRPSSGRVRAALASLRAALAHLRARPLHALLLAALAGCVALFVWAFVWHLRDIQKNRAGLDFHNYYYIAKGLLQKGSGIYDHRAMEQLARAELDTKGLPVFVYPPLIIVLFLPFAALPYTAVRIGWLVLNQLFLFATVVGLARIYQARTGARPSLWYSAAFALLAPALLSPMMNHNWQGQSNLIVLALVTWALYFNLRPRRSDALCGLFLASAILLKVFPGIFVPYLLARRQWRAVLFTALAAAAITLLTLAVVPVSDYLRFPEVLFGSMYMNEQAQLFGNHSAASAIRRVLDIAGLPLEAQKPISSALRFLPYPILLAVAARELTREPAPRGESGLVPVLRLSQGFILMGFIMAKWWEHHLVFFLVPYYVALHAVCRRPRQWALPGALIAASAVMVASIFHPVIWRALERRRVPSAILDGLMESKFIGILLLAVGLEVLIRQMKSGASEPTPLDDPHAPACCVGTLGYRSG